MKLKFLYTYTVIILVVSIIYLLVSVPAATWGLIKVAAPEFTMNEHEYRAHVNNTFFCEANRQFCKPNTTGSKTDIEPPTEKAITEQREASLEVVIQSERRSGLQDIVNWGLGGLFAAFLFYTHRKKLDIKQQTTPKS